MPFVKGDPNINRKGRPKGKTIKERVVEWLETHPDDMAAFVEHFVKNNKELSWQMLEGRPPQRNETDITSGGKPIPLFNYVRDNNSDNEDTEPQPED
jgi:hypothetical protein